MAMSFPSGRSRNAGSSDHSILARCQGPRPNKANAIIAINLFSVGRQGMVLLLLYEENEEIQNREGREGRGGGGGGGEGRERENRIERK